MHSAGRGKETHPAVQRWETVAGLIKSSKLFRLVLCNDPIVTMTQSRNKEDANLLSALTLSVFLSLSVHHCELRDMRGRQAATLS